MHVWILAWMEAYEAGVSLDAFPSEAAARAAVDVVNAKNGNSDPFIEDPRQPTDYENKDCITRWKNKGLYFVELYRLEVNGAHLIELTKLDRDAVYIADREKLSPEDCRRLERALPGEVVLVKDPSSIRAVPKL